MTTRTRQLPQTGGEPEYPVDRLGRPLRDLRLSVIEACNFRCPYCMPADRIPDDYGLDAASRLSFDEIETLVRGFVRVGVSKLRLTGGEPLLRRHLHLLVERLARIDGLDDIALTTNGSLLAAQATRLYEAGLGRVTVSVDTLDTEQFQQLSGGRGRLADVLAGIAAARDAGFAPVKLNCVIQRDHNEDQVMPLVEFARDNGHVLRFIEYMDVGNCNGWRRERVVASSELLERIHLRHPLRALQPNYRGEVASRYAFEDGRGEIGFVSSVSAPFCGDCHRARVSADGTLYTCLFSGAGQPLRPLLAGIDADNDAGTDAVDGEARVAEHVAGLWTARTDRYSETRAQPGNDRRKVEMYLVGG